MAVFTPTRAAAWRSSIRFGLGAVLTFRLVTEVAILAGLYGAAALPVVSSDPGALARPWQQWDAHWEVAIAQSGFLPWSHAVQGTHILSSAGFQPVLPGLMHLTAMATGMPTLAAGLLIVTLALAAAAVGLHRLVQVDFGVGAARFAVVLLMIVPTAVFLGAPYAEPLVLAEVIWAFLALRSGRPLTAGMLVGLAAMTKLYAITFALPIAVEALALSGPAWRPRLAAVARVAIGPALAALGLVLFFTLVFKDPLRFLAAQQQWVGRQLAPPWVAIGRALNPPPALSLDGAAGVLDLACVVVLVLATGYAWKRLRRSYAVLLATQLLVFTSTTVLAGTSRWMLDAFPVFIAGGVLAAGRPRLRLVLVSGLVPAAALFLWIYSHGGWVS